LSHSSNWSAIAALAVLLAAGTAAAAAEDGFRGGPMTVTEAQIAAMREAADPAATGSSGGANGEWVLNGGFETGELAPWESSDWSAWSVSTTSPFSGNYCAHVSGYSYLDISLKPIPVSAITSFTFYYRQPDPAFMMGVHVNYDDYTGDYFTFYPSSSWTRYDFTSELEAGKNVCFLRFWGTNRPDGTPINTYLDAVSIQASDHCYSCPTPDYYISASTSYQRHAGSFSDDGCRIYEIDLTGGTTYRFTFCEGLYAEMFRDSTLTLYSYDGSSCTQVAYNDDYCDLGSQLDYAPPVGGTYFLRVDGYAGQGLDYTLEYKYFADTCAACPAADGALTPAISYQTVSGNTGINGCDRYAVSLTTGNTYVFTFCDSPGTANYDTILRLYNGSCEVVAEDDDFCAANLSQISYVCPSSGTYYIEIKGYGTQGGSYTLAYKFTPHGPPWEFNEPGNPEDWSAWNSMSGLSVAGGTVSSSVTGGDPYMGHVGGLSISAAANPFITARLRSTSSGEAEFFFSSSVQPGIRGGNEVGFT